MHMPADCGSVTSSLSRPQPCRALLFSLYIYIYIYESSVAKRVVRVVKKSYAN